MNGANCPDATSASRSSRPSLQRQRSLSMTPIGRSSRWARFPRKCSILFPKWEFTSRCQTLSCRDTCRLYRGMSITRTREDIDLELAVIPSTATLTQTGKRTQTTRSYHREKFSPASKRPLTLALRWERNWSDKGLRPPVVGTTFNKKEIPV